MGYSSNKRQKKLEDILVAITPKIEFVLILLFIQENITNIRIWITYNDNNSNNYQTKYGSDWEWNI